MKGKGETVNDFFVSCFYTILRTEEEALEKASNGKLTIKEIHLIDAVYRALGKDENNFSTISNMLGVTLGTLTTSFAKLERKGYLTKVRDENDKRVFYIIPTKLAEQINAAHTEWHERLVAGIVKVLPEKELENLEESLRHLAVFIQEKMK